MLATVYQPRRVRARNIPAGRGWRAHLEESTDEEPEVDEGLLSVLAAKHLLAWADGDSTAAALQSYMASEVLDMRRM